MVQCSVLVLGTLLFACGLELCGGESFNFEVARRTHDNVENFLASAEFPTQELVEAFALGVLNVSAPTYFADARVQISALLTAVPQIGAIYLMAQEMFVGIVNGILITTQEIFGGTCAGGVAEDHMCLNLALVDAFGNPTTFLGTRDLSREALGIYNANTTRWSAIRQLAPNAIGTEYAKPIYNSDGLQLGTVSAGVMTGNLDTFLFNAFGEEPDNRVVYIVERTTGKLVAASVIDATTAALNAQLVQVSSFECSNNLIRESSTFLFTLSDLQTEVLYVHNGYYVQSTPYTAVGIDWLIVVVRPADIQDDFISTGSATYLILCVIIGLCALVTLCLIVWVIRFRKLRLWKAGQPEALVLVLIANLMCVFAAFTMMGAPTNANCLLRMWFMSFSLVLLGASLIAKLLRVYMTTNTKTIFTRRVFRYLTPKHVVAVVGVIMAFELVCATIWTIVDPYTTKLRYRTQVGVTVGYEVCKSSSYGWVVGHAVFGFVLIVVGCYLSYVTRNVSEMFAESRALMAIIYHCVFIGAVLVFVFVLAKVSIKSFSLFVIAALIWVTLTTQLGLFLPRIYRQVTLGDFSAWEMKEFLVKHLNRERQDQQNEDTLFVRNKTSSNALVVFGQPPHHSNNKPTQPAPAPAEEPAEVEFVI